MKKTFLWVIVLLLIFSGMACADTASDALAKGIEACTNGNYTKAAKWYRKSAEQGDAIGQRSFGSMYYFGNCIPQNYAEAAKWINKAADQGDANAQIMLGGLYYCGYGVPQNYKQAYIWLSLGTANIESGDQHDNASTMRDEAAKKLSS